MLKDEYPFLKEVDSIILWKELFYLDDNLKISIMVIKLLYKNLWERKYRCNVCYDKKDRDVNLSINIMFEGLRLYIKEVFGIV